MVVKKKFCNKITIKTYSHFNEKTSICIPKRLNKFQLEKMQKCKLKLQ